MKVSTKYLIIVILFNTIIISYSENSNNNSSIEYIKSEHSFTEIFTSNFKQIIYCAKTNTNTNQLNSRKRIFALTYDGNVYLYSYSAKKFEVNKDFKNINIKEVFQHKNTSNIAMYSYLSYDNTNVLYYSTECGKRYKNI